MTLKPCLTCGTPSSGSYCTDCRPRDTRIRNAHGQAAYDPVWRALSLKARKAMPWCHDCGADTDLTADHILPKLDYPELVHAIENITTRCRSCNSRRGATPFTATEAHDVLTRLQATYKRRPTGLGRERVAAAQRATDHPGRGQSDRGHPVGKAQGAMNRGADALR